MRIALAVYAMRRPPGMSDSDVSRHRSGSQRFIEHPDLADRAQALELSSTIQHCQTRGVIAPVFQPVQSLHQDRDNIAFGDCSNDSTHDSTVPLLIHRPDT